LKSRYALDTFKFIGSNTFFASRVTVCTLAEVISKIILVRIPAEVLTVRTLGDLTFFAYEQVACLSYLSYIIGLEEFCTTVTLRGKGSITLGAGFVACYKLMIKIHIRLQK